MTRLKPNHKFIRHLHAHVLPLSLFLVLSLSHTRTLAITHNLKLAITHNLKLIRRPHTQTLARTGTLIHHFVHIHKVLSTLKHTHLHRHAHTHTNAHVIHRQAIFPQNTQKIALLQDHVSWRTSWKVISYRLHRSLLFG